MRINRYAAGLFMTTIFNLKPKTIRKIHSYLSLIFCFLLCFYLVTGFFLNHTAWFEQKSSVAIYEQETSSIDALPTILIQQNIQLSDARLEELIQTAELELSGPGWRKVITVESDMIEIETIQYGFIATLNDLHKNRHVHVAWTIAADIFIFFTLLMCLTGVWISVKNLKKKSQNITILTFGGLLLLLLVVVVPTAYSEESVATKQVSLEASVDIRQFEMKTENPYVALFSKNSTSEYKTHFVLIEGYKWVKDLKTYWRKIAREDRSRVDAHSGATRKAGSFSRRIDVSLSADEDLSDVVFYLEVSREKGGREILTLDSLAGNGKACVRGKKEISEFCLQKIK